MLLCTLLHFAYPRLYVDTHGDNTGIWALDIYMATGCSRCSPTGGSQEFNIQFKPLMEDAMGARLECSRWPNNSRPSETGPAIPRQAPVPGLLLSTRVNDLNDLKRRGPAIKSESGERRRGVFGTEPRFRGVCI